jgi:anti-sigma factor RsiW
MNIDELKELLPFFVAGTLDPGERKQVEEALGTSKELRKDLKFWQRTKIVVEARALQAAASHRKPEQRGSVRPKIDGGRLPIPTRGDKWHYRTRSNRLVATNSPARNR